MGIYKDSLSHTCLLIHPEVPTDRHPRVYLTDTDEQATHTQKVQQTQSEAKAADVPADPSASCVPLS